MPRIEPSGTIVINRTLTIEAVGYDNGATATLDAAQRFRVMEVLPPEQVPGIVCSSGSCSYDQGCPCVALQGNHTTHPPIYEPIEVRLRGLVLTGGYTAGGYIPGSWQQTWGCPDVPCVGWSYAFEGGAALRTYGGNVTLEGCTVTNSTVKFAPDYEYEGQATCGDKITARTDQYGRRMCRGGGGVCVMGGNVLLLDSAVTHNRVYWPDPTNFSISPACDLLSPDNASSSNSSSSNSSSADVLSNAFGSIFATLLSGSTVCIPEWYTQGSHGYGGGLFLTNHDGEWANATLELRRSTVAHNLAKFGAGIFTEACDPGSGDDCRDKVTLSLLDSHVEHNLATAEGISLDGLGARGGGLFTGGRGLRMARTVVAHNQAVGPNALGGGWYSDCYDDDCAGGHLVTDSMLLNNSAYQYGGGAHLKGGDLRIEGTTFGANRLTLGRSVTNMSGSIGSGSALYSSSLSFGTQAFALFAIHTVANCTFSYAEDAGTAAACEALVATTRTDNTITADACISLAESLVEQVGGLLEFEPCPIGNYSAKLDRTMKDFHGCPNKCAAGYFANATRYSEPYYDCSGNCPVGHFCPEGTILPQPCPAGRHSPYEKTERSEDCLACATGKFNAIEGQENCTACPPASYSASQGSTNCTTCKPSRAASARQPAPTHPWSSSRVRRAATPTPPASPLRRSALSALPDTSVWERGSRSRASAQPVASPTPPT